MSVLVAESCRTNLSNGATPLERKRNTFHGMFGVELEINGGLRQGSPSVQA